MGRPKRAAVTDASGHKKRKADPSQQYNEILTSLEVLQDEDETRACVTAFVKLPSKKLYADYYELIESPISLHEIHKKVSRNAYSDPQEFVLDFQLMYDNAVKYNDPQLWIVQDAEKLLQNVEQQVAILDFSNDVTVADLPKLCEEVLDEVINYDFPGEGVLSGPFMEDVDPEEYPDYYAVIDTPISFTSVRAQIKKLLLSPDASLSENLQAFHDKTTLIFTNAQSYNDPSSLIHEDSKKLQEVFEEKYIALRGDVIPEEKIALKLKLKAPKDSVKLKLNLKSEPEQPPKKRRGRKPKKLIEEERRRAALEAAMVKHEQDNGDDDDDEGADDESTRKLNATETHVMGKSAKVPPADEVFIRRVGFSSPQAGTTNILNSIAAQAKPLLGGTQAAKAALFPDAPGYNAASFFDFQFDLLGFSTKAYTVTLPQNSSSLVLFKVALHELIYNIKRDDLVDGQGILKGRTEEDFMCALYLNEEEVSGGFEMTEDTDLKDEKIKLLSLGYELKLQYGLNVITFELRLAPSLAKSLKREAPEPESNEVAGRHTRHQLQQIKLNWEVEKFTIYVVSGSA